jgi:catechol 2,3-dioxygenase-like lactoylglutathione lyase family enzyme
VVVPVSDVDRAKGFYKGLGWRLDADAGGAEYHVPIRTARRRPLN